MQVFLFPGQGSQHLGMGKELFQQFPKVVDEANEVLGYSVEELCLNGSAERLNETQYTQPALYVVNSLHFLSRSIQPDAVAGHSLGEYNALFASGVFDFATGLRLVQKRGKLMQQAVGGGMAAVIGLSSDQIQETLQDAGLSSVDIANYNAPNQIVISGPKSDIAQAQSVLEKRGAMMVLPLKVSGAFHSRYMQSARELFGEFLKTFTYQAPMIPILANVDARPYRDATSIASRLAEQLVAPVRWYESIRYLAAQAQVSFEEVGPGKVLTNLLRHIL